VTRMKEEVCQQIMKIIDKRFVAREIVKAAIEDNLHCYNPGVCGEVDVNYRKCPNCEKANELFARLGL